MGKIKQSAINAMPWDDIAAEIKRDSIRSAYKKIVKSLGVMCFSRFREECCIRELFSQYCTAEDISKVKAANRAKINHLRPYTKSENVFIAVAGFLGYNSHSIARICKRTFSSIEKKLVDVRREARLNNREFLDAKRIMIMPVSQNKGLERRYAYY